MLGIFGIFAFLINVYKICNLWVVRLLGCDVIYLKLIII